MNLTRPLSVIDVETTGLDPNADRIVTLAIITWTPPSFDPDATSEAFMFTFNPGRPIPPEATAIHGITDEMVKDAPRFLDRGKEIFDILAGTDYAGYRLRNLDLPILDAELRRCGLALPGPSHVIDVYGVWSKMEQRTLTDAVRRFCGRDHKRAAHDAMNDARATLDVLMGQAAELPKLQDMNAAGLAAFCSPDGRIYADLAGKLYRDPEGFLCYAFGRHKGERVADAPGFAEWMLGKDFPADTLDVIAAEMKKLLAVQPMTADFDPYPF